MVETPGNKRAREDEERDANERLAKRLSYDYSNVITVLVGPEGAEKSFVVHKDVICAHSKFFAAACSEKWREGQSKTVHIRDHAPTTFQAYMVWLSTHTIAVHVEDSAPDALKQRQTQADLCIELCLLGEFIDDIQLRNHVLKPILGLRAGLPSPNTITLIWSCTPPNNPLRRVVIDKVIMRGLRETVIRKWQHYPADFTQDLAAALLRQVPVVSHLEFAGRYDEYVESEKGAGQTIDEK